VRRIEAVTGPLAYELVRKVEEQVHDAATTLKTQPEHLVRRIEQLLEENKKLERRVEELLKTGGGRGEGGRVEQIGDVALHVADSDVEDRTQVGLVMDAFRSQHKRAISIMFTTGERPGIHVAVTDDLIAQGVQAGEIAKALAASTGGKGGGRAQFASGGVGDVTLLPAARAQTRTLIERILQR
jgi:alanyl-tRNA synthetase